MSGPGYPASAAGEPPPGQGYYHNNVGRRDDDRYERSPARTQTHGGEHDYNNQRGYPPSEATYNPRDYQQDPRQSAPYDDYASRSQANFDPERGQQRGGGGPPHLSRGNSYDTRADSEYTRGGGGGRDRDRDRDRGGRDYDDRSEYSRGPPASEYSRGPPASEYSRGPAATASEYTSRSRSRGERGGGSRHSRRKSDRSRRSPSSSRSRSRSRDSYSSHSSSRSSRSRGGHHRRRRSARTPPMERVMGYPSDPKKGGRDVLGGSEREKGLGAALAGGAGGAWLGHEFGKGKLETIGGAIAGAIAARAIERHAGKRKEEKREKRRDRERDRDRGYGDGERDRRFDDAYTVASSSAGGRRSGEGRRRGSGSSDGYGRD